jgi:hypothetical protein
MGEAAVDFKRPQLFTALATGAMPLPGPRCGASG